MARNFGGAENIGGAGGIVLTNADIAEELSKTGFKVIKSQIRMPNGPIKTVSDSTVSVALHTDVVVDVNVTVYGETAWSAISLIRAASSSELAAFSLALC